MRWLGAAAAFYAGTQWGTPDGSAFWLAVAILLMAVSHIPWEPVR